MLRETTSTAWLILSQSQRELKGRGSTGLLHSSLPLYTSKRTSFSLCRLVNWEIWSLYLPFCMLSLSLSVQTLLQVLTGILSPLILKEESSLNFPVV